VLRGADFEVTLVEDGQAAVEAVAAQFPGLVLLDVRMPNLNGFDACRRIREFSTVPIIMLTGLAKDDSVVQGLGAGADDYITKPFTHEVLLARVKAALRRANYPADPANEPVFDAGELHVDFARRQVSVGGREVNLSPREYGLLTTLAHMAGRVVVHSELLERVWGPGHAGEDELVRKVVHRLRRKIEPDPAAPRFIVTKGRVGYLLNRRHSR
jgi:DNA-binding response OmpR family regulator